MTQTGVYVGNDPDAVTSYATWVGSVPSNVLNFLNNDSWSAFDSSIGYEVNLWKGTGIANIWSVPLTVWGTSLEQVATGAYDSHFLQAAQALAQTQPSADGNIYVRVGWEFNGSWTPWAASGHEDAFVTAFQELVTTFRSVSGQFKFVWDVSNDGGNMDPAKAYPGDKYVDVIGEDTYYSTQWDSTDAKVAFQGEVARQYGLQWQQDFAAAHGKATAMSEWGVESDNAGPYVQAMAKWMSDHNMVYEDYWNSNADYSGLLSNGQNPDAGAAYQAAIASLHSGATSSATAMAAATTAAATVSTATVVAAPATAAAAATTVASASAGTSGTDTVVLKVSADSWQGDPHFVVTVDGTQVGGTLTTAASHAAGQTQDITLTGAFGSGAHAVSVQFLDDAYGGSAATDRNLYVHQISFDGHIFAGDTAANYAGSNSQGVADLVSNGNAIFQTLAASTATAGASTAAVAASTAAAVVSPAPSTTDTVVLKVSADSWQGDPHFVVTVDGTQVGGTLTTAASHAAGQTQDITLTGAFGSGAHAVSVQFLDDAYGGSAATDRNLYVHQISFDGHIFAGDTAANYAGSNSQGVADLVSNGNAIFQTLAASTATAGASTAAVAASTAAAVVSPAPSTTDTVVLKVSADSWQGDPHFVVTVDGTQVGGTLTTAASHAAGQTQDITLTGAFGSGAHAVSVQFLDDAYGGSAATDRNLYVHQISFDGHIFAGDTAANYAGSNSQGVADLVSNGNADWHI